MSSSASRFKRLPPPRTVARRGEASPPVEPETTKEPSAASGDLFAHYGVSLEAEARSPAPLAAIVEAARCRACGWLRPAASSEPCPICASLPPPSP